jgi:hypothetical protein
VDEFCEIVPGNPTGVASTQLFVEKVKLFVFRAL